MADDAGTAEDEEALVRAAQAGDGAAFLRLSDRYRPHLVRFLAAQLSDPGRVDLADVAQRTLDVAYTALPQLRDPARFRGWLFSIARRRLLDALAQREREVPLDTLAPPPAVSPAELPDAETDALDDLLATVAWPLSVDVVMMLRLRVQGESIAEVAARVGKTPAAVERALSRARRALRASRPRE